MSRQQALNEIWKRLLIVLVVIGAVSIGAACYGGVASTPSLVFLFGNVGSYVGVHRGLTQLSDKEVSSLAGSWFGLIVPSFVGGILAFVLYILFLSNTLDTIGGTVFPKFAMDANIPKDALENFEKIWHQHGVEISDYAKLFLWSFAAGLNQKYAVDIIESIRAKP